MTEDLTKNEETNIMIDEPINFWKVKDIEILKNFLKQNFVLAISSLSTAPITNIFQRGIDKCFDRIVTQYTNKDRKYHTLNHIADMINNIYAIPNATPVQKALLIIATMYHDYVYNFDNGQFNEPLSAMQFLYDSLNLEIPENSSKQIYYLILCTWYSKNITPIDSLGYFLQDIDFAALGYEDQLYTELQDNVKKEIELSPEYFEEKYVNSRIKWLQSLLDKPQIFHTDYFKEKYEEQARINVFIELETLIQ